MILTLSATGVDPVVMHKRDEGGYCILSYQWSGGVHREVYANAPEADGEIDTTAYAGSGLITLGLALVATDEPLRVMERSLRAFTRPSLRPTLTIDYNDGSDVLQATVSRVMVDIVQVPGPVRQVVVSMSVPYGILESETVNSAVVRPGAGEGDGLEFADELEFGPTIEFPYVEPPGTTTVTNAGDRNAYPTVRAFGPFGAAASETTIGNLTSGKSLVFDGLSVSAGDYLEINFRAKTILVNSLAAQSRYQYLKFPDAAWWSLAPGANEIAFRPDIYSGNAQMHVFWRDAYS